MSQPISVRQGGMITFFCICSGIIVSLFPCLCLTITAWRTFPSTFLLIFWFSTGISIPLGSVSPPWNINVDGTGEGGTWQNSIVWFWCRIDCSAVSGAPIEHPVPSACRQRRAEISHPLLWVFNKLSGIFLLNRYCTTCAISPWDIGTMPSPHYPS